MRLHGVRVWLTGASSGIGAALTRQLLEEGARVAASGRNEERLRALAGNVADREGRFLPVAFDARERQAAQAAAATINDAWGGLDWVILNAGDCEYLNPQQWDAELIKRVMDINFFGFTHCCEAALPLLQRANGRGLVAATASAAAYCPLPRAAAYGASKAALAHFLRCLEGSFPQLDFSLIYPGFVKTPLTDRNDFQMPFLWEADAAAREMVSGLIKRRSEIAFPRRLVWLLKLMAALPSPLRRRLMTKIAASA